jgi:uncharacterized protein YjiS (DUF1127 family)
MVERIDSMSSRSHACIAGPISPPASALARALRRLLSAAALRRQRARLSDLDPHILRDIGLSEGEAQAEARRSVWDVPANWRR